MYEHKLGVCCPATGLQGFAAEIKRMAMVWIESTCREPFPDVDKWTPHQEQQSEGMLGLISET